MKKPTILLLSYKFPPFNGVGARRWALFSNEFANQKINLYIICYNWKEVSKSYDISKIEKYKIFYLNDPVSDLTNSKDIFLKIKQKLGYLLLKILGSVDEADFFYKWNKKKIINLIKKNKINTLIATGGPFSSNFHAAKIKEKIPEINLIQDFRDTWTQVFFWEYPEKKDFNNPNYLKQFKMERFSLIKANAIVNVCEKESELMKKSHPEINENNFHTILNGYDLNDLTGSKSTSNSKDYFKGKINIAHFGTLSFGRDKEFFKFIDSTKHLLISNEIKIIQFGKIDKLTHDLILKDNFLNKIVFFEKTVPLDEMHLLMAQFDIHLVVNDLVFYYTMGSKIYDAILHKKPILLISKSSTLSELVNRYKLGWHTENSNEMNINAIDAITNIKNLKNFSYSMHFNAFEYSIQNRALEYIKLINDLLIKNKK